MTKAIITNKRLTGNIKLLLIDIYIKNEWQLN